MFINEYELLEILNGIWALLDLCLLAWFTFYIWDQFKKMDPIEWSMIFTHWWSFGLPGHINAAIAIYVFTFGDFIVRSHIWYWRHMLNHGVNYPLTLSTLLFGSCTAVFGVLCKIRVFTYSRFRNKAWYLSLSLTLILVFTAVFTHWNF